jgi:putative CRISPR-associated protein (TIGR02619 family)
LTVAHIVLVGTSVWRNLDNALKGAPRLSHVRQHLESLGLTSREAREAAELCARATPGSHGDAQCGRRASPGSPAGRAAREAVVFDPWAMSAELNAMKPWLEALEEGRAGAVGRVILVHSDTGAGSAASAVLRQAIEQRWPGVRVEEHVAQGLGSPESLVEGLSSLYRLIAHLAGEAAGRGECVLLNPTGGFKVESGYALLAAQRRALAAYYIHESFHETVVLPLPPLAALVEEARRAGRCGGDWCVVAGGAECLVDALEPVGLARRGPGGVEVSKSVLERAY